MATIRKRVASDGRTRWQVQIRLRGRPPVTSTFDRKTDASAWVEEVEREIRAGRYGVTIASRERTVADLARRYTNREPLLDEAGAPKVGEGGTPLLSGNAAFADLKPKEQAARRAQLDWWAKHYGHLPLANLTRATILEGRDRLAAGDSPSERRSSAANQNRYIAALRAALTFGVEIGWVATNTAAKREGGRVARPEPKGRVRYLSNAAFEPDVALPDEYTRLLAACRASSEPRLYPLVFLALATGARQGELLGLRWGDVNLAAETAVLRETKNGTTRALHLAAPAVETLRELARVRRLGPDLVFTDKAGRADFNGRLRGAFERAVVAAKLSDFRFHDLRHTHASYLAMSGATLLEIAAALGHKTLAMVQRYSHLCKGHQAAVVSRMAGHALRAV